MREVTLEIDKIVIGALRFIGRHPLPLLILPSAWFFTFYLPFWKSSDVLCQLGAPFAADNVLLVPPIYCILGRLPFWVADTLVAGSSPDIFASQHPSLGAVYALIVCQHISLWLAVWYFVGGLAASETARGVVVLLLASIASFYSFAHTAGAEATTAVTWFALFGVGLRIVRGQSNWKNWMIYVFVLLLCIGSRHVGGLMLAWLPVTAFLLATFRFLSDREKHFFAALSFLTTGTIALVLSVGSLVTEQSIVSTICRHFGFVERPMQGRTLCERIGSFLDFLSPGEKEQAARRAAVYTRDSDVKQAIDYLITIGTYYGGSDLAIAEMVQKRGLSGERLNAEVDRITLEAAICYYRTFDARLIQKIVEDTVRGFYPTNDQGIALTGAKATYASLASIEKHPEDWANIRSLLFFEPEVANATLERAYHDNYLRHWRFMPLGVWCLLFAAIGGWRAVRQELAPELVIVATCMFAIGLAVHIATCVCNISQPRYVLPLWVGIIASGCVLIAGKSLTPRYLASVRVLDPACQSRRQAAIGAQGTTVHGSAQI
jgi:hypothetical protein